MKFGKQFKKQMVPEWTEAYVDYNGLKRILGQILRYNKSKELPTPSVASNYGLAHRTFSGLNLQSNGNVPTNGDIEDQVIAVDTLQQDGSTHIFKTNFLRKFEEGGENEVMFFSKLDEELNKVNTFYRDKVEEVKTETALLSKQMNAFIALQIKVENPDFDKLHTLGSAGVASATPLRTKSRGTRTLGRECMDYKVQADGSSGYQGQDSTGGTEVNPDHKHDLLEILEHVKINNPLESPISSIKGFLHDSKEEELRFKKEEIKKVKERLRHVFMEFYQKLHLLKHYSFMNLCAFSKIMKKYEKFTSRRAARSYMEIVDNSYLGSCDEVIGLLERVEATFIEHFSNSNRREAMKLLRPKAKRERHNVTFFSGFFSGCSVALLVGIVLRLEAPDLMATEEITLYMEKIFPLYSLFAFIVLHMLMYAANIYFWRRYRVNYPFIFGFKQGTELGYREVFFLASGLAVLALASFLTNLHLDMSSGRRYYKTVTQLVPLGLVTVVLVVTFCPFDIIYRSSRFFFIRCIFHCLCAPFYQVKLPDFFLADQLTSQVQAIRSLELYVCYYSLGEFSSRENKCHSDGVYNAFYFIVAVIPYWLRFLQCLRRLCEDKDAMHGYNGLKYLLAIIAVLMRTAFELKKGISWKVLALISSGVATAMNTYWDLVVDWGLLRQKSKNFLLRDKLIVSHKSVYFAAMFLNVLLRLAWLQLVLEFHWIPLGKMTISTVISCLEIIRRGIWSFFRLENEHLNNVGKYRAFKSVPLPFNYYDTEDDDDDTDKDD